MMYSMPIRRALGASLQTGVSTSQRDRAWHKCETGVQHFEPPQDPAGAGCPHTQSSSEQHHSSPRSGSSMCCFQDPTATCALPL